MATISGGNKLEAALNKIASGLKSGAEVRVGFLENATYPDGTSVALVAAIQNFGSLSRGIPPRPFFSNMVVQKSPDWPKAVALNLKATGYDAEKTMDLVGTGIEGQLRQSIIDTNAPPNAPSTIAAKGGASKPLVDTGHMLQSIDHEVEAK